jgi:Arc/MetJ family transcription regulator
MNIDHDLVREAARVLGTKTATETVHRALEEVIARQKRIALANTSFADLTDEELAELRATRTWP